MAYKAEKEHDTILQPPPKPIGLQQAIYIFKCLNEGESEQAIVDRFKGEEQLVKDWITFLHDIKWLVKNVESGESESTEKGTDGAKSYKK